MFNKKIKIIILGIAILFLLVVLIFKIRDDNAENNKNGSKKAENNIENNKNGSEEAKNNGNKAIEDETAAKLFEELKNNHPEFSASQLEFYHETAGRDKAIITPCEERNDVNDCIASVAFLKDRTYLCREIENEETKIKCANSILREGNAEKVDKCWLFGGDDFIKCSRDIFLIYDKPENCLNLKSEKTQQMCESVFYYETAFLQRNGELCKRITDEKLNQYCKNTIDKFLDSDSDGLTDYKEIFKYKTDPNKRDTDKDGYSDGDEVKKGYNPLVKGE